MHVRDSSRWFAAAFVFVILGGAALPVRGAADPAPAPVPEVQPGTAVPVPPAENAPPAAPARPDDVLPPAATGAPPPAEAVKAEAKALSESERKKRRKSLPERYRRFLDDVEPILLSAEEDVFLKLPDDALRDRFIQLFWRRRNEVSGGRNDTRERYYSNLADVKERYARASSEAGRVYLIQGAPDEIKPVRCEPHMWPLEVWSYSRLPAWRRSAYLLFFQPNGIGPYELWTPAKPLGVLFQPGENDPYRCADGGYMSRVLGHVAATAGGGWFVEYSKLMETPVVDLEGLEAILASSPDLPEGAKSLKLGRTLRFPRQVGGRIATEITALVPRDDLARKQLDAAEYVDVELVGEIVMPANEKGDEKLVDSFRYRFDVPIDAATSPVLPFTAERLLRPGLYRLRLRVSDVNRNAAGRIEETLAVPDRPEGLQAERREEARGLLDRLAAEGVMRVDTGESAVTIEPIAGEALTGLKRIEVAVKGEIGSLEFFVDNVVVGKRRKDPWALDVDLGKLPRPRVVKVIARSSDGVVVGSDETVVNESKNALRVQLLRPHKGARALGPTRVEALVLVPEGRSLAKLELFLNDQPVATLFGPPYAQAVDVKDEKAPSVIRARVTLSDGESSEDVRFVNAPEFLEEVDVERVELYVAAAKGGRLVADLAGSDFRINVDDQPVEVAGFEVVRQLPISVVLALDTSESMREELAESEKGAAAFVASVLTPKDRAAIVRFDDEPQLLQRFTKDKELLKSALATLSAESGTALYDAIVYSLYQFQGQRGRKALVLLSDGRDTSSRFEWDQALEFAKRSGVAVYVVGLAIPLREWDVRAKLSQIADETGGRVFHVDKASDLVDAYRKIDEELRTQYRLAFAPPGKANGKWHRVEVRVPGRPGVDARAASGYYR